MYQGDINDAWLSFRYRSEFCEVLFRGGAELPLGQRHPVARVGARLRVRA